MNLKERQQERDKLEYQIQYRLNNIIESIKADGIIDIGRAQGKYGDNVASIIRKGATEAYDIGAEYTDTQFNFYGVTEEEIQEENERVKEITNTYIIKFWRRINILIHRNDTLLQKYDFEPRSPLNSNYMATSTAIGLITRGMAYGTLNKTKHLQQFRMQPLKGARFSSKKQKAKQKKFKLTEERKQKQLEDIDKKMQLEDTRIKDMVKEVTDELFTVDPTDRDETVDQVVWNAINDQNTCEPCAELDGEYFGLDDAPIPSEICDGGDNCRCTLDVEPATSMIIYSDEEDELDQGDIELTASEF